MPAANSDNVVVDDNVTHRKNLDDLFNDIGSGPHQWLHVGIMCLILMIAGSNLYSFIFLVAAPDFRCFIPQLDANTTNPTYDIPRSQLLQYAPCNIDSDGIVQIDNCRRFTQPLPSPPAGAVCSSSPNNTTVACSRWIYDTSVYLSTGVTEFNLVCERRVEQAVVQDMYQIGLILGCGLSGYVSDKIGRRYACMLFLLLHAVIGVGNVFMYAGSLALFEIFRVLCGFTSGALSNVPLVYALELVSDRHRKSINFLLLISMTTGAVTTGAVAWALHGAWRPLQLFLGAPAVLPLILLTIFGSESFRWLLSKRRYGEAERVVNLVCKRNTKSLQNVQQILFLSKNERRPTVDGAGDDTWLSLWTWPQMRLKLLILLACWLCVSLVLTGLQVNSVNLPGLNVYVSFIIVSAMEFPGNALALLTVNNERLGRRNSAALFFILTGVLNAVAGVVPQHWSAALILTPTFLAKLTSTATWNAANIFAAELFPTTVRNSGLGLCFLAADVGGIVAPFVSLLSSASSTRFIPPLIFCAASIVGGVLCTFLPETLNADLTQTVEQAEKLRVGAPALCRSKKRSIVPIQQVNSYQNSAFKQEEEQIGYQQQQPP